MRRYEHHFSVAEANGMVPRLRRWFAEIHDLDRQIAELLPACQPALARRSQDVGGPRLAELLLLSMHWRHGILEILAAGIEVKDVPRGLVDFPHLLPTGDEVYLCWELAEATVGHWHALDGGFETREPLGPRAAPRPGESV